MSTMMNLFYDINGQDHIVLLSENWMKFARENNGAMLQPDSVLGRPLWDFITDRETLNLYQSMVASARSGREIDFILRCDSFEYIRHLRMQIFPRQKNQVRFQTTLVKQKKRTLPGWHGQSAINPEKTVTLCSWCNKIQVDGGWQEIEDAVKKLKLFEGEKMPRLNYGICQPCYESYKVA